MNNVYITLLTSADEVDKIKKLNNSLKAVDSKFNLIIAAFEEVLNNNLLTELLQLNCHIEFISKLTVPNIPHPVNRISLFKIDNIKYHKMFFIDPNYRVLQNIDNVFDDFEGGSLLKIDENHFSSDLMMLSFDTTQKCFDYYNSFIDKIEDMPEDLIPELFFYIKDAEEFQISFEYFKNKLDFSPQKW